MDIGCDMAAAGLNKAVQAGEALTSIANKVSDIDDMNASISSAAQEQSAVSTEVSENVVRISYLTEHTTEGATKISQSSQELMGLVCELQEVVSQFKV